MIKVTIGEFETQKENPFPKFMICKKGYNKGMIVLMSEPFKGTVICNGNAWRPGAYCDAWDMEVFEDYNQEIKIQNV